MSKVSIDKLEKVEHSLSYLWRLYNEWKQLYKQLGKEQDEIIDKELLESAKKICDSIKGLPRALYFKEFDLVLDIFYDYIDYEQYVAPLEETDDSIVFIKTQYTRELNLKFAIAFTLAFRREKFEEIKKMDMFDQSGVKISQDVSPLYDRVTGGEARKMVDDEIRYQDKRAEKENKKKEKQDKKEEKDSGYDDI